MSVASHPVPSSRSLERGTTLVEMMVVIAIIGSVSAIAVMSVRSSRATGRTLAGINTAHAYGNAIDRFAS